MRTPNSPEEITPISIEQFVNANYEFPNVEMATRRYYDLEQRLAGKVGEPIVMIEFFYTGTSDYSKHWFTNHSGDKFLNVGMLLSDKLEFSSGVKNCRILVGGEDSSQIFSYISITDAQKDYGTSLTYGKFPREVSSKKGDSIFQTPPPCLEIFAGFEEINSRYFSLHRGAAPNAWVQLSVLRAMSMLSEDGFTHLRAY